MTFERFVQSDEETWHDPKKLTKTKTKTKTMTKTKIFWEHLLRAILETCDIWDTEYNSDNWEPEFMTIFVTWQLIVTLDSIRNSCDVLSIDKDNLIHTQGETRPIKCRGFPTTYYKPSRLCVGEMWMAIHTVKRWKWIPKVQRVQKIQSQEGQRTSPDGYRARGFWWCR